MTLRKIWLTSVGVSLVGAMALPAVASADVRVYLNAPPPPVRVEPVPAPRRGYVWVPGYWDARGHRHVWHNGYWVKERHGYHYRNPEWVQRDDRWELNRGGWDRDHDGVPNSRDRAPNNPYRR